MHAWCYPGPRHHSRSRSETCLPFSNVVFRPFVVEQPSSTNLQPIGCSDLLPPIQFRVPIGREILRAAKEIRADLIALGAKSRKGPAGHVLHSKAYEIVCGAPCPVLALKS